MRAAGLPRPDAEDNTRRQHTNQPPKGSRSAEAIGNERVYWKLCIFFMDDRHAHLIGDCLSLL